MTREIKLFVTSDDRHNKYFIQAQVTGGGINGGTTQAADVIDLGFDAPYEHGAVHNLLKAIGAEVNRDMMAIRPEDRPATVGFVTQAIDAAIQRVFQNSTIGFVRADPGDVQEQQAERRKVAAVDRENANEVRSDMGRRKRRRRRRVRKQTAREIREGRELVAEIAKARRKKARR